MLVVAGGTGAGAPTAEFMDRMRGLTATPLSAYSPDRAFLPQTMADEPAVEVPASKEGMVAVPTPRDGGLYAFECKGNIQQGDSLPTIVDVQFPFEASPRRNHRQTIRMRAFHIDRDLVTNSAYKAFLDATRWSPALDRANWLNYWVSTAPDGPNAYASWAAQSQPNAGHFAVTPPPARTPHGPYV